MCTERRPSARVVESGWIPPPMVSSAPVPAVVGTVTSGATAAVTRPGSRR